ncbi:MAG: hypothetical protein ABJE95_09450 [Byssovorax sp.]
MNDLDTLLRGAAVSHRCSGCSRRYIEFGESAPDLVCSCGAPLVPHALQRGTYELGAAMGEENRVTTPGRAPVPKEHDRGYGASHGYDVTHGGPSGPGDAPADVTEKSA